MSERPPTSKNETGGSRDARILIVEDERLVAMALRDQLERLSYSVVDCVATGEEANRD